MSQIFPKVKDSLMKLFLCIGHSDTGIDLLKILDGATKILGLGAKGGNN